MTRLCIDLALRYPQFELDVRLDENIDSITVLFGPSGSGKSALLRCIAGLEPAARGEIALSGDLWLDSKRDHAVAAHSRGVGMVFQDARLFTHLSVHGNLHYAERRARAVAAPRIEFAQVVAALDLATLLPRKPATLSGGERQRVALGRALLTRPRLLLLDEPLSALDVARKDEILPYLERLPAVFGIPALYVTHDLDEAVRLASRMIVLRNGRVVTSGAVQDVLERPETQAVTGRFEAGVVLTTRVLAHDAGYCLTQLDVQGQHIVVPQVDAAPGAELRIRIRARDVALATRRPEGSSIRNVLAGVLSEVRSDPASAFAETVVEIGAARLRARVTRAAVDELGLAPGASVFALVKSIALDAAPSRPEAGGGKGALATK